MLTLLAIRNKRPLICLNLKSSVLLHTEYSFTVKVQLRKEQLSTYRAQLPDVHSHDRITFSSLLEDKDWIISENRMLRIIFEFERHEATGNVETEIVMFSTVSNFRFMFLEKLN